MLGYIRCPRGIENRCHWVLDAIYREDHNRMPFEGQKHKILPKRELRASHDTQYLEQLLSIMYGP